MKGIIYFHYIWHVPCARMVSRNDVVSLVDWINAQNVHDHVHANFVWLILISASTLDTEQVASPGTQGTSFVFVLMDFTHILLFEAILKLLQSYPGRWSIPWYLRADEIIRCVFKTTILQFYIISLKIFSGMHCLGSPRFSLTNIQILAIYTLCKSTCDINILLPLLPV